MHQDALLLAKQVEKWKIMFVTRAFSSRSQNPALSRDKFISSLTRRSNLEFFNTLYTIGNRYYRYYSRDLRFNRATVGEQLLIYVINPFI